MNKEKQLINEFAKDFNFSIAEIIDGDSIVIEKKYRRSITLFILSKDIKSYTRYFTFISFDQCSYLRELDTNRFGFRTKQDARNYIYKANHSNRIVDLLFDYVETINNKLKRINERQEDIFSSIDNQNKIYTRQLNDMITEARR